MKHNEKPPGTSVVLRRPTEPRTLPKPEPRQKPAFGPKVPRSKYFKRRAREEIVRRDLISRLGDMAEGRMGEMHTIYDSDGNALRVFTESPLDLQRKAAMDLVKIAGLRPPPAPRRPDDGAKPGGGITINIIGSIPPGAADSSG